MVGLFTSCVEIREEQAYIVKCQPRYESYAMLFFPLTIRSVVSVTYGPTMSVHLKDEQARKTCYLTQRLQPTGLC